jgi:hypothetical protein
LWNEQNEHMETAMALVVADAGVESAQLDDLTVAQLHILCAACGLTKRTGGKANLVARLRAKLCPQEEEPPRKKQKTEGPNHPTDHDAWMRAQQRLFMSAGKRGGAAGEDAPVIERRFGGRAIRRTRRLSSKQRRPREDDEWPSVFSSLFEPLDEPPHKQQKTKVCRAARSPEMRTHQPDVCLFGQASAQALQTAAKAFPSPVPSAVRTGLRAVGFGHSGNCARYIRCDTKLTAHGCARTNRLFMCAGKRGGAAGEDARVGQRRRFGRRVVL